MKVIIAGSRNILDLNVVEEAVSLSGFTITEVVSGHARGVDTLGETWAKKNNIPIKLFIPDWDKHGKSAGFIRNVDMIKYVEPNGGLIAIWDGLSRGTNHSILTAKKYNILTYIHRYNLKQKGY
jgi:hypothetical protein